MKVKVKKLVPNAVIPRYAKLDEAEELSTTERGTGGYGSTGK